MLYKKNKCWGFWGLMLLTILLGFNVVYAGVNLEKIFKFDSPLGCVSLNSKDDTLMISFYDENRKEIWWYKNNKVTMRIKNASTGVFSPNGKYYSYIIDNVLYIKDEKGKLISNNPIKYEQFETTVWSYNSEYIYWCEHGKIEHIIYRFNTKKKEKEVILKSARIYFHPVTVRDNNVIYLLENPTPNEAGQYCNIVKYNLLTKKIDRIKLPPIDDLWIFNNFTVSPDGKLIVFIDNENGSLYVVDTEATKIIDKVQTPTNNDPMAYSWKSDGSYIIFDQSQTDVYKYTLPKK